VVEKSYVVHEEFNSSTRWICIYYKHYVKIILKLNIKSVL